MDLRVLSFIKKSSGYLSNYYPEVLGTAFVINASGIFRAAWELIKKFLDPRTAAKVIVKGDDYKEELLKHVLLIN